MASLDVFETGIAAYESLDNDSVHESIKIQLVSQLNQQGILAASTVTFEVTPGCIRHPDVAVLLRRPEPVRGRFWQGAPDLAVEIVSDSDMAMDVDDKIHLYLAHGARAVWVVWPRSQRVDIHQTHQPTRQYHAADTLAGEEPVPQFRSPIASLFG